MCISRVDRLGVINYDYCVTYLANIKYFLAARYGAAVANHVEVKELLKKTDSNGKEVLCGAKVRDALSGKVCLNG